MKIFILISQNEKFSRYSDLKYSEDMLFSHGHKNFNMPVQLSVASMMS